MKIIDKDIQDYWVGYGEEVNDVRDIEVKVNGGKVDVNLKNVR